MRNKVIQKVRHREEMVVGKKKEQLTWFGHVIRMPKIEIADCRLQFYQ